MEDGNLAVLVDAKTEYTKQLINILKGSMYIAINTIFLISKEESNINKNMVLKKFQENLSKVPSWNQDIINNNHQLILKHSGCDWLDELITAVFVSHTRILTSINTNKNKGKINLKIPKTTHFIHKCYIDVARYFWKNSYLFDDKLSNYEKQKNRREAENIIEISINETIRKEIPLKHILKEYLGDDYIEAKSSDLKEDNKLNLRKMVMHEINNCSKEKLDEFQLFLNKDETKVPVPTVAVPVVVDVAVPVAVPPVPVPVPVAVPVAVPPVPPVPVPVVVDVAVAVPPVPVPVVVAVPVAPPVIEKTINLDIEELNLDDMVDLNKFEEVYFDEHDSNSNGSNSNGSNEPDNNNIKTISLKPNKKDKNTEGVIVNNDNIELKKNILDKYKDKSNFKFF